MGLSDVFGRLVRTDRCRSNPCSPPGTGASPDPPMVASRRSRKPNRKAFPP